MLPAPKRLADLERWKWSEIAVAMPRAEKRLDRAHRMSWDGCVYFLECDGFTKIGFTKNLRKRLSALQLCNPKPIRFLAILPGDRKLETALHKRFADHRSSGEWFCLEGTLRDFLLEHGCDV